MMRDPLAAALLGRGTFHGHKGIGEAFIPISPEERDSVIRRLELDQKDMVCLGCGSTKPLAYFKGIGAMSCCPERKMVEAASLVAELAILRDNAPASADEETAGMEFGPPAPPFRQHVRGEAVSARIAHGTSKEGLRLFVNLTKKLAARVSGPRVDMRPGDGKDQDKILLTFGDQGAFHVCRQRGHKTFLILPVPKVVEKPKTLPIRPCAHAWRAGGTDLVVTLPLEAWKAAA
jgi:hypothetical protein